MTALMYASFIRDVRRDLIKRYNKNGYSAEPVLMYVWYGNKGKEKQIPIIGHPLDAERNNKSEYGLRYTSLRYPFRDI